VQYQIKKEAMVAVYNMCENHQSKFLQKVMQFNPLKSYIDILNNYYNCDPYLLQVAISFCSLICEKYGQEAIQTIINSGVCEMIENIQYKYAQENETLSKLAYSFIETYIYSNESLVENNEVIMDENEFSSGRREAD